MTEQNKSESSKNSKPEALNSPSVTSDKNDISAAVVENTSNQKKADAEKPAQSENKSSVKSDSKTTKTEAIAKAASNDGANLTATQKQKLSKTAVFAVLLALIGIGGVAASFFYQQQLMEQKLAESLAENKQSLDASNQSFIAQLKQQSEQFQTQVADAINHQQKDLNQQKAQAEETQVQIARLRGEVGEINVQPQVEPSDWALNEAEFLIRIANRTLMLEKNTSTADALLREAEQQVASLNDPQYLPLRAAIRQDIEQLALLPKLDLENIVLSLMALNQQVANLTFPQRADLNIETATAENTELSEQISDWRENLYKSWLKFRDEFITVSRVNGPVTPLLTPDHHQNLKQNLALKLQLAQWAATQQSEALYQQTLTEIDSWLNQFFDMDKAENQHFLSRIQSLKTLKVTVDYPQALSSLKVIRDTLQQKQNSRINGSLL